MLQLVSAVLLLLGVGSAGAATAGFAPGGQGNLMLAQTNAVAESTHEQDKNEGMSAHKQRSQEEEQQGIEQEQEGLEEEQQGMEEEQRGMEEEQEGLEKEQEGLEKEHEGMEKQETAEHGHSY